MSNTLSMLPFAVCGLVVLTKVLDGKTKVKLVIVVLGRVRVLQVLLVRHVVVVLSL